MKEETYVFQTNDEGVIDPEYTPFSESIGDNGLEVAAAETRIVPAERTRDTKPQRQALIFTTKVRGSSVRVRELQTSRCILYNDVKAYAV